MNRVMCRVRRADAAVLLLSVSFLVFSLAAGGGGRERAKRTVCLANLRQLMSAWIAYADQNDGNIVNGAAGFHFTKTGGMTNDGTAAGIVERAWVGTSWGDNWNTDSVATGLSDAQKKRAVHEGALWPLMGDERCYKCPVGRPYEWVTYAIVDAMNGLNALNGRTGVSTGSTHVTSIGTRVGDTVLWIKNTREIIDPPPARRMVFIDQGAATPDSFGTLYRGNGTWWDDPPVRHNDGTTVSWADGHASDYRWIAPETIEFGRRAANRYYGGFAPKTEEGKKDLDDFRRAVWGRIAEDGPGQ
jgi:prepilin-type processing-associated H-X9-DG protein